MIIAHSHKVRPVTSSTKIKSLIESISPAQLREWVEHIAKPRHYIAEARQNRLTAGWLSDLFSSMGLHVIRQGEYSKIGLDVKLGIEKYFPVLARSDHAPFWAKKIPALMWTDTSEFRNHHYHRDTDTPGTLDYRFLRNITQLLTACVIQQAQDVENEP